MSSGLGDPCHAHLSFSIGHLVVVPQSIMCGKGLIGELNAVMRVEDNARAEATSAGYRLPATYRDVDVTYDRSTIGSN